MIKTISKKEIRKKRLKRIRHLLAGASVLPRLVVIKTNKRMSAQLIDDAGHRTIFTLNIAGKNIESGKKLGAEIAKACIIHKIKRVVFDRSGFQYHGVIKTIADSVREGGVTI